MRKSDAMREIVCSKPHKNNNYYYEVVSPNQFDDTKTVILVRR